MKRLALFTLFCIHVLLVLSNLASASSGDRQPQFQKCVADCVSKLCDDVQTAYQPPVYMKLLMWDCPSDCDYHCQRKLTLKAQSQDHPGKIHQYHGKWPFIRILGVQEPASVVFSIMNGYAHYRNWSIIKQRIPKGWFSRPWLLLFVIIGSWTWLWSSIYHTRDFPFTEKMDYYSAGLSTLYILFFGLVYLFRITNGKTIKRLAMLLSVPYFLHVYYLHFIRFDYTYNMAANIGVGLISCVVWLCAAFNSYKASRPMWWKPVVLIFMTMGACSLEVFDFPPFLDSIDAHSLWHLATVPIIHLWYDYLISDAEWQYRHDQRIKD